MPLRLRALPLKWLVPLAALIGAAAVISLCLLLPGQADTVVAEVACDECGYRGPAEVPVGRPGQPAKCPKCGKLSAFHPVPCPKCFRPIAWNPKAPPTTCPHCKAPLDPDVLQP